MFLAKYLSKNPGTATYTFMRRIEADSPEELGIAYYKFGTVVKCFADGICLPHFEDVVIDADKKGVSFYATFQVYCSQNGVLVQMASLFAFAASHEFKLVDQTFTPE